MRRFARRAACLFVLGSDPIPELKAQLAGELVRALKGWQPTEAHARLGLDQPRLWDLRHGRLERFSLQRLIRLLALLRYRVAITLQRGISDAFLRLA